MNKALEETYRHLARGDPDARPSGLRAGGAGPQSRRSGRGQGKELHGRRPPRGPNNPSGILALLSGFNETGASLDSVAKMHSGSLETMAELAEIEVGLFRLVREIKKTIKRINALENIYLPRL